MITVSPKAIAEAKRIIKETYPGKTVGLRVGVKGGGCSGLSYVLDFVTEPRNDDKQLEFEGLAVYMDPKSAIYLKGTNLDFSDGLNGKGFTFVNPNAQRTCGCGSSFSM
jgi:iron-sulfur cluster assembly protein